MYELLLFFVKLIGAFFAGAALSVAFQIPKKYFVSAGLTAAIGWATYLITTALGWNMIWANYTATLFIAFTAQLLARKKRVPATMFLIPGIIPIVPGGGMYRIIFSMLYETSAEASAHFYETLLMAGAIAMGIFTVDTFFRISQPKIIRISRQ